MRKPQGPGRPCFFHFHIITVMENKTIAFLFGSLGTVLAYKIWSARESQAREAKKIFLANYSAQFAQLLPQFSNKEIDTLYEFARYYFSYARTRLPDSLRLPLGELARKYHILPDYQ